MSGFLDKSLQINRICLTCGLEKQIEKFGISKDGKDGRRSRCNQCRWEKDKITKENRPRIIMLHKICPICKMDKDIELFHKCKNNHDKHDAYCKTCITIKHSNDQVRKKYMSEYSKKRREDKEFLEHKNELNKQREAKKKKVKNERVSYKKIRERDLTCYICNKEIFPYQETQFDHKIPLQPKNDEPQGEHTESNIFLTHKVCNLRKSNKRFEDMTTHEKRGY